MADPTLCVDTRFKPHSERFGLEKCMKDEPGLGGEQTFHLTWRKDIRAGQRNMCWDVPGGDQQAPIFVWDCHGQMGNQYWLYDTVRRAGDRELSHVMDGLIRRLGMHLGDADEGSAGVQNIKLAENLNDQLSCFQ